jgi:tRNA(Ile)-lysidine synthetase-like protein
MRRHRFVCQLATTLRERCGVGEGDRLLLAVSGGADSLAMLLAMHWLADQPQWQLDLHVGHVQHHLRHESEREAALVERLADTLGWPFHRRDIDLGDEPGNLEAGARRQRYAGLRDIAGQINADAIATAHHLHDQMETVLMRLMRGASIKGLGGIAYGRRLGALRLIRPALDCDPADARDLLLQVDQPWCEDPTNADTSRDRAFLRHRVLPLLNQLRPDAASNFARSAAQLREQSRWLDRLARQAQRRHVRMGPDGAMAIDRAVARGLAAGLLGSLVRRMARQAGAGGDALPARLIQTISQAARSNSNESRRFDLAGGAVCIVDSQSLRIKPPDNMPGDQANGQAPV